MNFSKTTAYSIRILTLLAQNKGKVVSVKTLHQQLELPFKYITKLMTALSKKGLVKAIRGREGGFLLAREANDISIFNIVEAVEGTNEKQTCSLLFNECSDDKPCSIHFFIHDLKKQFRQRLVETKLDELAFQEFPENSTPE